MKKLLLLFGLLFFFSSQAQILNVLKDVAKKKATEKATNLAGDKVKNAITREAITTNFKDCDTQNIKNRNFGMVNLTKICAAQLLQKMGTN